MIPILAAVLCTIQLLIIKALREELMTMRRSLKPLMNSAFQDGVRAERIRAAMPIEDRLNEAYIRGVTDTHEALAGKRKKKH